MNANENADWIDGQRYIENRNAIPAAEWSTYPGQWVAVLADGTRIVGHHEDMLTLARIVAEAGLQPTDVVMEFIPENPDEVELG